MKNLMKQFWKDEAGVVVSTEIILIALLLVLGLIAGMTSLRDQTVQELGDLGEAINHLDASYQFVAPVYTSENGATGSGGPATLYDDDDDENNTQVDTSAPEGINLDGHVSPFTTAGENASQIP